MGIKDYGVCPGVDSCFLYKIPDEYTFPEYCDIPAFDTVKRNNLGAMLMIIKDIMIRRDLCSRGKSGHREVIIGLIDVLGGLKSNFHENH